MYQRKKIDTLMFTAANFELHICSSTLLCESIIIKKKKVVS
jgi:hypothetical protein